MAGFSGFRGCNGLVTVFATRRVPVGLVEGFRVKDGGVKTAGLDLGIRLVPNGSGRSGRETGVFVPFFFPCGSLEQ